MTRPAAPASPPTAQPGLSRILGSLILGADHPLTLREIRRILESVEAERRAESGEGPAVTDEDLLAVEKELKDQAAAPDGKPPADAAPEDENVAGATGISGRMIRKAIHELQESLRKADAGLEIVEVNGGFRFQTQADCGPWVRRMLNRGKPQRISRPMIETLAIIAYRQPISRSEIESIRGVSVGHVLKALMEMQLVRIIGRSDLPGRPFLFGTTSVFLDHFGLKNLNELNTMQPGVSRTPVEDQRKKHFTKKPEPAATSPAAPSPAAPAPAPLPLFDGAESGSDVEAASPESAPATPGDDGPRHNPLGGGDYIADDEDEETDEETGDEDEEDEFDDEDEDDEFDDEEDDEEDDEDEDDD